MAHCLHITAQVGQPKVVGAGGHIELEDMRVVLDLGGGERHLEIGAVQEVAVEQLRVVLLARCALPAEAKRVL